jgi:ketosteroid isomerase-like protein
VPASAAASAELWAPDCTLLIPGNNRFSGEHRGREPQQLFADGRGHVVGVLRWTADRDGRHLDSLGASVYAIVGGRLASLEQCEEDVGRVDVFWGGNAGAGAGLATDWRADIDTLLRSYQANEETPDSAHREACTADVRYHVPGHHPLSGDLQAPTSCASGRRGPGGSPAGRFAGSPSARSPMAMDT